MQFRGASVVITGGSGGIGGATAHAFAKAGADVAVVDIDSTAVKIIVDEVRTYGNHAIGVVADVTKSTEVARYVADALDAFGKIDCFFNNAGIEGLVAPITEYDEDTFDDVMRVNVRGVFLGMKHVLPAMIARGAGAVVNTASVAGLVGTPGMSTYCASKHAVLGMMKSVSGEVARSGVRVNAICPGPVQTRMIDDVQKLINPEDPLGVKARYEGAIPSGRYSQPDEIADIVLFLCSDAAKNVTGMHFTIDGGRTATGGAVTQVAKTTN
ncbi:MAG: SDR family NAD(P)-dependent oxidoreductase [Hyphomicrobiaceae bacterium]